MESRPQRIPEEDGYSGQDDKAAKASGGNARQPRKSVTSKDSGQKLKRTISDAGRRGSERDSNPTEGSRSRRPSQWIRRFSLAGSQMKSSDAAGPSRIQLENTYHMGLKDGEMFNSAEAKRALSEILNSYLGGEQYHANRCRNMAKQLCDVIRSRIQMTKSERYRLVVILSITQKADQGYQEASRCLWDTATDRWVSISYQNETLAATATVYAVYFE